MLPENNWSPLMAILLSIKGWFPEIRQSQEHILWNLNGMIEIKCLYGILAISFVPSFVLRLNSKGYILNKMESFVMMQRVILMTDVPIIIV